MVKRINLALQGGGAHGAFTWGVLDRLLDQDDIEIAAISGTSAGALNGAAFKAGLLAGGRQGARDSLDRLWEEIAQLTDFRMAAWMQPLLPGVQALAQIAQSLAPVSVQGLVEQVYSPYAWGAAWQNPLDPILRRLDFSKICDAAGPRLFVGATNVETGRIRIFSGQEIAPEALMASACLPSVFQTVTIDGVPYWDGGYSGNPALFPLYLPELPDDILIVSINPLKREGIPMSPMDINNRLNEISFNAALLGELRAVNFVRRLIREGRVEQGRMKSVLIHMIGDDDLMNDLSAATKLLPSPALFARLKRAGRAAADGFLARHGDRLNKDSSVDLSALFG